MAPTPHCDMTDAEGMLMISAGLYGLTGIFLLNHLLRRLPWEPLTPFHCTLALAIITSLIGGLMWWME